MPRQLIILIDPRKCIAWTGHKSAEILKQVGTYTQ